MTEAQEAIRNVIVVGTDMADTGQHALREGMRLALQLPGSSLHAVHVLSTPESVHDADKLEKLSQDVSAARDRLRDHVTEACRPTPPAQAFDREVILHVRLGKPAEALLQVAVDEEADMLVVGTHARTGVQRWVMGSVAEELLRIARCPVVVAHPKHYKGLEKTEQIQPPHPGQDLHSTSYRQPVTLHFPHGPSHIAGLI